MITPVDSRPSFIPPPPEERHVDSLHRSAEEWTRYGFPGFGDQLSALAVWMQRVPMRDLIRNGDKYAVAIGNRAAEQIFTRLETAASYGQHNGNIGDTAVVLPVSTYKLEPGLIWVPSIYTPTEYGLIRRQWGNTHRNPVVVLLRDSVDRIHLYTDPITSPHPPRSL